MKMSGRAVKPLRAHMGRRLRDLRAEAQLTQEGLGTAAGVSGKFVGELERGLKSPTADTLWRVIRALVRAGARVDIASLFTGERRGA